MEKSLITFLLLFNGLNFGKTSLFCCKGYIHATFTILFNKSQEEELSIYEIKKYKKSVNDFFCCFTAFYDLKYLISTKSRLSLILTLILSSSNFKSLSLRQLSVFERTAFLE